MDVEENKINTVEYDMHMKKIREEVYIKLENYRKTLSYMCSDAPLGVLCLSKSTEKALLDHGCLRVYDILDMDLVEVKGLSAAGLRQLTASLDQFLSMG